MSPCHVFGGAGGGPGARTVAVAAVANKERDYDEGDLYQLALLMEGTWSILQRKQGEEALRQAHDELELRVEERTAELRLANEHLLQEIEERELIEERLRKSEERFRTLFHTVGSIIMSISPNRLHPGVQPGGGAPYRLAAPGSFRERCF
jgi:PAS domain-containing protein